jgi:UDP-N-acetylglucosamine 2-epimerase
MLENPRNWNNPLGDGRSAVKIINIIQEEGL